MAARFLHALVVSSLTVRLAVGVSDADDAPVNRPVSKVISLLKEMLATLEKEGEGDKEIYDKMECWCTTGRKEKEKSIADAEARIQDLTTSIEGHDAATKRLASEIKGLEKEVAENQKALDQATSIREKEQAAFNGQETDLTQSISSLKAAVQVLKKHHAHSSANAFLQVEQDTQLDDETAATLQHALLMHEHRLSPDQRDIVQSFIQGPDHLQAYGSQSGQIFGIIRQMLDDFSADLSEAQKEENARQAAYDELKEGKVAEIEAGQEQLDTKKEQLAGSDQKLAENKQELEDTKKSLVADREYLANLNEQCENMDKEWEKRQNTRQEEMEAVSAALATLTEAGAQDLFVKTFNPGAAFLQAATLSTAQRRAAVVLSSAGLASLAMRVQLDSFKAVIKTIDDMMAALATEKADEIKKKDVCREQLHENKLQIDKNTRKKADLETQIETLKQESQALADEIEATKAEMKEMAKQMKRAGENREKENAEFMQVQKDQRDTIAVIKSALTVLKGFYDKKGAFAQEREDPPPPSFKSYENNKQAGGVMGMIQTIISDAEKMLNEAIRDEADSQKAYEKLVKDTNKGIAARKSDLIAKDEEKSQKDSDKIEATEDLETTNGELDGLANNKAALHAECDFVLKNFDVRQEARDQETEALKQAKAILQGADYE